MKHKNITFSSWKSTYKLSISICLVAFIFVGCEESNQVTNLRKELEITKTQIAKLEKQLEAIKIEKEISNLVGDIDKTVVLKPGSKGYSTIKFDLGVFTISIVDVTPYANGSKIALEFGNPLLATINGIEAKVEYGKVNANGFVVTEGMKSKDIVFSESFRSGAWTKVNVVLEGFPTDQLGFVTIKNISHKGIVLSRNISDY